jgi:hypothetical protein
MREAIIQIILSIPGLGTIEHVQRSGIDMDDIELAVDKIMDLQVRETFNQAIDDCITKLSSTTQVAKLLNELKK